MAQETPESHTSSHRTKIHQTLAFGRCPEGEFTEGNPLSISINSIIVKAAALISIIITTIYIYVIASPSHLIVFLEHLVVDLHVYSFIHSSSIHNINTMMFIAFMCE